jgi:hypothetical protein
MAGDDIWEREEGFWLDGPGFFEANMAGNALMVFPDPVGILKGRAILEGLRGAPRWDAVEMAERTEAVLGDTRVLAYRATGRRAGAAPHVALCSSSYARVDGAWRLVSHQQTPVA